MSSTGAASHAAVPVSHARAEASRRNGAKSRGPRTEAGKARASRNALKHGLRAQKHLVLPEEDAAGFAEHEAALLAELAPVGALQAVLARRVVVAGWRIARADRIEVELFAEQHVADGSLGLALIRDGNGTRSFETLLRYRGAALAEFSRALRTLKALQAEAAAHARTRAPERGAGKKGPLAHPIEPEPAGNPRESGSPPRADEPEKVAGPVRARTNQPAPGGAACACAVLRSAERTRSWAGGGRDGGQAGSETDGARSDRTAPGAPESQLRSRPQLARSTP